MQLVEGAAERTSILIRFFARARARRAAEPYPVLVSGVSLLHGISPLEIPAPRQHYSSPP